MVFNIHVWSSCLWVHLGFVKKNPKSVPTALNDPALSWGLCVCCCLCAQDLLQGCEKITCSVKVTCHQLHEQHDSLWILMFTPNPLQPVMCKTQSWYRMWWDAYFKWWECQFEWSLSDSAIFTLSIHTDWNLHSHAEPWREVWLSPRWLTLGFACTTIVLFETLL